MAAKIDAYVDTSALIAFMDASDTYHALFRRLFAAPPSVVVTSSLTLVDTVGLHLMRDGRVAACWSTDRHLGPTGVPLAIHAV